MRRAACSHVRMSRAIAVLRSVSIWLMSGQTLIGSISVAQDTVLLRDVTRGAGLSVELEKVVSFAPPASGRFEFPTTVLGDKHGRFYVLDEYGTTPVWVFDGHGRSMRSISRERALIDRSMVRALAMTPPDTLHVISGGDAIFDASGNLIRQQRLSADVSVFRALGLADGRWVAQAIIRTGDLFGYPLHIFDRRGARQASFGSGRGAAFDGNPSKVLGSLARSGDGEFWAATQARYCIDLWTSNGVHRRVLERRVDWFQNWTQWNGRVDIARPPPRLVSIWEDAKGRLLTLTLVAAVNWQPIAGRSAAGESPPPTAAEFERAHDTIIEVIEPARGQVIASRRVSQTLISLVNDSLIAGISTELSRGSSVDIWKLQLLPKPR